MTNYQYWQDALAGKKPKMFVDQPELGFYRKSIVERNAKGTNRRIGWTPVAVYIDGDAPIMVARVGNREVIGDELNELWSYIAGNPISEEWYRAVSERGEPWPDAHDPSKNKRHPSPEEQLVEAIEELSTEEKLAREIAAAKAGISQYERIDSDTMAGQALSLKNTITSLAGDLDKIRQTLVRPHVDAQAEINGRLNPIIKDAKSATVHLLQAIGSWEDQKRAIARQAAEAAEKKERERLAAAQKAEAEGRPAPPPVVHVAPNAPPPSTQVAAAVGRKASVKVAKFVTDIDMDKAFAAFRNEPAVKELLMQFAQKAINAGLSVDGSVIEERSIVR